MPLPRPAARPRHRRDTRDVPVLRQDTPARRGRRIAVLSVVILAVASAAFVVRRPLLMAALLNAVGAVPAALASRPWWRTRPIEAVRPAGASAGPR